MQRWISTVVDKTSSRQYSSWTTLCHVAELTITLCCCFEENTDFGKQKHLLSINRGV
jgi:hypothetical protein